MKRIQKSLFFLACVSAVCAFLMAPRVSGQVTEGFLQTLPESDGAWALRIVTTGGLDGRGRGTADINSTGTLLCVVPQVCRQQVAVEMLSSFNRFAQQLNLADWTATAPSNIALCNDCYFTQVIFARRKNGKVEIGNFFWNTLTQHSVAPELFEVVELALARTRH